MSIQEIPFASITEEVAINFFNRMTNAEVRKKIDWQAAMQDGVQSGYIFCFTDFFGEASEEESVQSFENGTSFIFVMNTIIACHLSGIVADLAIKNSNGKLQIGDLLQLNKKVSVAVRQYVRDNFDDAVVAIQSL